MTEARWLVVNADDFGRSAGVNEGVLRAHDDGIVTSASLMVRWPTATDAIDRARSRPGLGLGLHLDFGEWIFARGSWEQIYRACGDSREDVEREVSAQIERFHDLVGRPPTHLDSHQHVHIHEPFLSVVRRHAANLEAPLRLVTRGVVHCGEFYGQTATGEAYPDGISVSRLLKLVAEAGPGVTELACHPGAHDDEPWSVYSDERQRELEVLCAPKVVAAVRESGAIMASFASIPNNQVEIPG